VCKQPAKILARCSEVNQLLTSAAELNQPSSGDTPACVRTHAFALQVSNLWTARHAVKSIVSTTQIPHKSPVNLVSKNGNQLYSWVFAVPRVALVK